LARSGIRWLPRKLSRVDVLPGRWSFSPVELTKAMPRDFLIVCAAVREDRQEIRAARFILERCGARPATCRRAPTDMQIRRQLIERDKKEFASCNVGTCLAGVAEVEETLVAWETELRTLNGPN
jgi:hypothetical protein